MKKSLIITLLLFVFATSFVLAECDLDVQLVNQDPDPAVPGDYVRLLFQVSGIAGTECGEISFELLENYPIRFDPDFNPVKTFSAGTFARGFSSNRTIPYKVRVDPNALDGDEEIEILYSTKGSKSFRISKLFDIRIEEVKADFQVFIRSYNYDTRRLTLEVLNTGKNDVRSLVLTIPSQENVRVLGGNKNIVGDLDSNDYTSTDFEALPEDGIIVVELEYTDKTGERRQAQAEIVFESERFEHTIPDNSARNRNLIIIAVLVLAFIVWRVLKKKKKKLIR
jgi:hypothetical protein